MKAASPELRLEILKCTPASFLTATDRPDSLGALLGQIVSTGDPSTDLNKCLNGLQDALDRENEKEAVVAIRSAKAMLIDPVIKTLFEGLEYEIVGQYVDAELIYKKILKEYPGNTAAWGKLGLLLQRFEDRAEEAKDAYQKVIELDPADWWAWWMLGRLNHKQLNNYEAAEEAYRKALSGNEKLETAWAQLGQLLHETNRPAEAEVAYKKAITLDPKYKWAWAQYGELLHDKLERYEEAKNAYDKVIALDPEYSWAWAQLGSLFHEKIADYGQAETAYRKALDIDSEYGWAWGQLGHLLHEHTTRYDEAEAAYDKAIQLCSDNPYPRILRAMLLFEHTERHVEAITSIYEFIEDPEALYMFARLFIELGYYTETLPILSKTLAHPEFVGSKIDDMTTLFAELAAGGQAKAAIPILRDSKCAVILEPILVALRMSVGEEVAVAPEIEQIAKDVLKEFEAMKEKRANSKKPELLH
jgi:tetratricopeptide (TPR) repeat protein